jgi:prepilin peptidase CpaA
MGFPESALTFPNGAALAVALAGCVSDLKTRRIPNVLTLGAASGAAGFHLAAGGWSGLGWSLAGWCVGLLMFLPILALRGIGGGDVKLLAALGAWIGPGTAVWLALWTAIAGGPLAIIVALGAGYLRQALRNVWSLVTFWRVAGLRPHPTLNLETAGAPKLPYALPIAAGLVVTLWTR